MPIQSGQRVLLASEDRSGRCGFHRQGSGATGARNRRKPMRPFEPSLSEKQRSPLLLAGQELQGSPNAQGNAACAFLLACFSRDHLLLGGADRQKRKSGIRFCKEPRCRSPRGWILAQPHRGRVMQKADLGELSPQAVTD